MCTLEQYLADPRNLRYGLPLQQLPHWTRGGQLPKPVYVSRSRAMDGSGQSGCGSRGGNHHPAPGTGGGRSSIRWGHR